MEGNSTFLEYLGAPAGGGISAVTIAGSRTPVVFAGTAIGLYRSRFSPGDFPRRWEYLPHAPLGILALAASPQYDVDHLIFAGTTAGLYYSHDEGETWYPARLPQASSTILCFAFSPQFEQDGMILAGSLEDGILFSDDRGRSWHLRSFGLLDATVYCLSLSPNFANDGIVFAGTQTALYYSYNHARAWRMFDFPEDAAPILSLAVSPSFSTDGVIFAGTETMGLFRSVDKGESWHKLPLNTTSVPAICYPSIDRLLIASESGLCFSPDRGETWEMTSDIPDGICLSQQDHLWLAGTADQGLWAKRSETAWEPLTGLTARAFVGMALSPQFAIDRTVFLYGPQEGIWKTSDGGKSWHCLNDRLPSSEVESMTITTSSEGGIIQAAATPAGCLISEDAGNSWQTALAVPVRLVASSASGKWLAAALEQNGVAVSNNLGKTWQPLAGEWDKGGEILALQIKEDGTCCLAWLESAGQSLSLWQGQAGNLQHVLRLSIGEKTVVSIYIPPAGETWFAAIGRQVWKMPEKESVVIEGVPSGEALLGLSGVATPGKSSLFTFTTSRLFHSADGIVWQPTADFRRHRAIAQAAFDINGKHMAAHLLAGGVLCQTKVS